MRVAAYWARAELRRRWRAWLVLAVLLGVGGGLAAGALIGARRTQAAYPRFLEWADAPDLVVDPDLEGQDSDPFLEALLDVPGVVHRSDARAVALAAVVDGLVDPTSVGAAVASVDGERFYVRDRVLVTEGRMPDPDRPDEVLVSESVAVEGLAVGDRLSMSAVGIEVFFAALETGFDEVPAEAGMQVEVTVTGIGVFPELAIEEPDLAADRILVTPALYRQLPGDAQLWDRAGVYLADDADPAAVRRAIQELSVEHGGSSLFEARADIAARAQRAVRPYVLALAGFGVAVGTFVVLLGLQLVRRLVAQREVDHRTLRALGADGPSVRSALALPAVLSAVAAITTATATAVAVAHRTPVGPVRGLGADTTPAADPLVLVPAALVLLAVTVVPTVAGSRRRSSSDDVARGRLAGWAQQAGAPLPVVLGIRGATGGGERQRRNVARAGLASVALAVGMLVAIATFATSLDRLLDEPAMHGWNADVALLAQDGYGSLDVRSAGEVDGVATLSGAAFGSVSIGEVGVAGMAVVPARGSWLPPIVDGTEPAVGELLVGARSLAAIGAAVGDTVAVQVPGEPEPTPMRIAGTAVFPGLGQLDNDRPTLGDGALLVLPTEVLDGDDMAWSAILAELEPGVDRAAVVADLVAAADEMVGDTQVFDVVRPADIAAFARLGFVPTTLLLLFALLGVASLVHVLLMVTRGWRRDGAVLAALGATPRQLRAAARWHALTALGVALLVAVPAGIAIGRWAWRSLAVEIGIVPDPVVPTLGIAVLALVLVAAAALTTLVPELLRAGTRPARDLRAE